MGVDLLGSPGPPGLPSGSSLGSLSIHHAIVGDPGETIGKLQANTRMRDWQGAQVRARRKARGARER